MFKIEKIIAEKSTSKNYAGVNSSSNWSSANRSLKRETVVLCCYKNINANYQISGLKPILSSNGKKKPSKLPFIINLNYLVKPPPPFNLIPVNPENV